MATITIDYLEYKKLLAIEHAMSDKEKVYVSRISDFYEAYAVYGLDDTSNKIIKELYKRISDISDELKEEKNKPWYKRLFK